MWKDFLNGKIVYNVRSLDEYLEVIERVNDSGIHTEYYDESRYLIYGEDTCLSVYNGYLTYAKRSFYNNSDYKILNYKNNTVIYNGINNHEIVNMKELLKEYIDGNVTIDDFDYITAINLDNHFIDKVVNLDLDVVLEMIQDDNVVFVK